jgi:hypothetical protein
VYLLDTLPNGFVPNWTYVLQDTCNLRDFYTCYSDTSGDLFFVGSCGGNYASSSQVALVRIQPNGDLVWFRTYMQSSNGAQGYSICRTAGEGFLLVGHSVFPCCLLILRIAENGDLLWRKWYSNLVASNLYQIDPNRYRLVGATRDADTPARLCIMDIDSSGELAERGPE